MMASYAVGLRWSGRFTDDIQMQWSGVAECIWYQLAGAAAAEESPCDNTLLKVCIRTANEQVINCLLHTGDCFITELSAQPLSRTLFG